MWYRHWLWFVTVWPLTLRRFAVWWYDLSRAEPWRWAGRTRLLSPAASPCCERSWARGWGSRHCVLVTAAENDVTETSASDTDTDSCLLTHLTPPAVYCAGCPLTPWTSASCVSTCWTAAGLKVSSRDNVHSNFFFFVWNILFVLLFHS